MELLADENIESEWLQALADVGYDVLRVIDVDALGQSADDADVLDFAASRTRVLLTADQADFTDPPTSNHAGIIIVSDGTLTGGDGRLAVRRIDRAFPDLAGTAVVDERYGRAAADAEGVDTRGTLFIVLTSVRDGHLSPADGRDVVDEMIDAGWYCSTDLYSRVVRAIESMG